MLLLPHFIPLFFFFLCTYQSTSEWNRLFNWVFLLRMKTEKAEYNKNKYYTQDLYVFTSEKQNNTCMLYVCYVPNKYTERKQNSIEKRIAKFRLNAIEYSERKNQHNIYLLLNFFFINACFSTLLFAEYL